jgi:hypothetical protein
MVQQSYIVAGEDAWLRDPLAHPAISRMSLEDIADLPFEAHAALPTACEPGARQRQRLIDWIAGRITWPPVKRALRPLR